jgi:hypothetical protein
MALGFCRFPDDIIVDVLSSLPTKVNLSILRLERNQFDDDSSKKQFFSILPKFEYLQSLDISLSFLNKRDPLLLIQALSKLNRIRSLKLTINKSTSQNNEEVEKLARFISSSNLETFHLGIEWHPTYTSELFQPFLQQLSIMSPQQNRSVLSFSVLNEQQSMASSTTSTKSLSDSLATLTTSVYHSCESLQFSGFVLNSSFFEKVFTSFTNLKEQSSLHSLILERTWLDHSTRWALSAFLRQFQCDTLHLLVVHVMISEPKTEKSTSIPSDNELLKVEEECKSYLARTFKPSKNPRIIVRTSRVISDS